MPDIKLQADSAITVIIDTNTLLANNGRVSGDYANDTKRDFECDLYWEGQYDTTAPTAGDEIARVWNLPGDGQVTELFPEGGSGNDPQGAYFVGSIFAINPSITVNEIVGLPSVILYPFGNRFVIKNVSGQQWSLEWEVRIRPRKIQVV